MMMSLSELHFLVERVRFGALVGGQMNLWSLDCVKLFHGLDVAWVFVCICFVGICEV